MAAHTIACPYCGHEHAVTYAGPLSVARCEED